MEKTETEMTTTDLTNKYIKEHPDIKSCLKKGIINYSSLARMISTELKISKKTSNEAILIAARRFKENLKKEVSREEAIKYLLSRSEIEIKNKMAVIILEKSINLEDVDEIQKTIRKSSGTFYLLEGSDNYTIITQEKYLTDIKNAFKTKIIKSNENLALINLKSPKDIEQLCGVVAYLSSLFAENGVNIIEFLSCWTDTLFIIESKEVSRAMNFLTF
jgi:hypothetical protein